LTLTIDTSRLRELGATLAIGYDAWERAWHVSIVRDGHPTIEVADVDAQTAIDAAMRRLLAP